MTKDAFAAFAALLLAGCATAPGDPAVRAPEPPPAPPSGQSSVIAAAAARPGFAGAWSEGDVLVLAFDPAGYPDARSLAGARVRVVPVRFALPELEAARQRTVRLLEAKPGLGMFAVTVDKPGNRVQVEAAEIIGSPGSKCLAAGTLPPQDPVNGVPVANAAACTGPTR
ncbi:MAG TPA: hypothetical protein VEZ70_10795 [Allosphingosinicella sp.]|nr:hypothetical protein [Allosphingosinicella sp.]